VRSGQSVAAMTLLKGHLVLEEKITASIEKYVFNAEALENARLIFSHKLSIARSISLDESKNSMWSFPCCEDFAGCLRSISSMIRSAQRLASEIAPPAVAASSPSHGTTRQAGHKALHRLGNAPADPTLLGSEIVGNRLPARSCKRASQNSSNLFRAQPSSSPESGWSQIKGAAAMRFRRSREVYPIFGSLGSLIERNDWCTLSASGVSYADLRRRCRGWANSSAGSCSR